MEQRRLCYRCMRATVEGGRCVFCGALEAATSRRDGDLALAPGTKLDDGHILVGEKIGNGGFGITYIALDARHGRIALKEFVPRYMLAGRQDNALSVSPNKQDIYEKSMKSFMREARLLSRIRHPNIVKVLFALTENDTAYYGMDLLQGEDLKRRVQRESPLSPEDAWSLLLPLVDALIYLHSMKTLHRDLSPDNIFLRREETGEYGISPCLIDFGAAFTAIQDFTQTMPGVKKNGFSPLEQNWAMENQGPFTDVYAFCATYYYAVTGHPPLPASERMREGVDMLEPMSTYVANVSAPVERAIRNGLALKPMERTQDMISLRREMSAAFKNHRRITLL